MGEIPASLRKLSAFFQTTFTCSSVSLEAIIEHKKEGEGSVFFSQEKVSCNVAFQPGLLK
jgi:hypothetical protein